MWWQQPLSEFVTLLLVINPIGVLPVFLVLVAPFEAKTQRKIALKSVLVAFVVLIFFIFAGKFLLTNMHIPVRAFQIAGGIVLFLIALEMIRGEEPGAERDNPSGHLALAIYPLGIPKIAGPGAMLAVILLTDDDRHNFVGQLATVGILAAVLAIQFVVLLAASPISRLIGAAGAGIIGRVMGMLLAALAVSAVLTAIGQWLGLAPL